MLRAGKLDSDLALVLVIDLQEKLLPLIDRHAGVVRATAKLLDGAAVFGIPIIATEQYPKGLGPTHADVAERLKSRERPVIEKPTFSACGADAVREAMQTLDRSQVVLAGIESHICVQQTALDLVSMDYDVFVCADAVGSRSDVDYRIAMDRLRQAGAVVTTVESALFELCDRCDTAAFKKMIEVIKAAPPTE